MATQTFDEVKAEAFGGHVVTILNGSFTALLLSVGYQTGLLDTLAHMPPATSERIAAMAGLNERYVREWLGGMAVSGIVAYDRVDRTFSLPPEHAASLTRAAGTNNMAKFMQYIAVLGNVEGDIIDCFRNGGGVPYSAYPRFQQLQAEETRAVYDETLVQTTLPLVPGLIDRLHTGADALDIGCGQGHAINVMARAFPRSRFTGYDFSAEGVRAGRDEAAELGLDNARFAVRDATSLDATEEFDFILAADVIHDLARPEQVLAAIARALRPGGTLLMIDIGASSDLADNIDHPMGAMLYGASIFHCMAVSLSQGGPGLGTMWGEQTARRLLEGAGFAVEIRQVPGDILNNYYIATRH
jgi:2-polyprenyl-3-methyl-5-hydroxy-6-metoxy-1,4-benzoquinol methylase